MDMDTAGHLPATVPRGGFGQDGDVHSAVLRGQGRSPVAQAERESPARFPSAREVKTLHRQQLDPHTGTSLRSLNK